MQAGIDKLTDAVAVTLGPRGEREVCLKKLAFPPIMAKPKLHEQVGSGDALVDAEQALSAACACLID